MQRKNKAKDEDLERSLMYQLPIGILGGTFDPIHFGHLRMAVELQSCFHFKSIQFIPCFQPTHKEQPVASPTERLKMVELAVKDIPGLEASDIEIQRQGVSYTIDTLREMKEKLPDTPLCLILGIDAFNGLSNWREYEKLIDFAHIIIAYRPHYELATSGELADYIKQYNKNDPRYIEQNLAGGIFIQPITALEISASSIRQQFVEKKNTSYLLPDSVYDYIMQNRIYHR